MSTLDRRKFIKLIALSTSIAGLSIEGLRETVTVELRRVNLNLGLGATLLVVTDTHLHGWGWVEETLKASLLSASLEADVLVFLGDGYDHNTPGLELLPRLFSEVSIPKIGVLGNHEHWAADKFPLEMGLEAYRASGFRLLLNEAIEVRGIRFGGLDWFHDETYIGRSYLKQVGKVDVLLSHTPDAVLLEPEARLVLSGHTHGGQVCLPFLGPIWVPSKLGRRYASGVFDYNGLKLVVSRGAGESGVPLRLNCPREILLVDI